MAVYTPASDRRYDGYLEHWVSEFRKRSAPDGGNISPRALADVVLLRLRGYHQNERSREEDVDCLAGALGAIAELTKPVQIPSVAPASPKRPAIHEALPARRRA